MSMTTGGCHNAHFGITGSIVGGHNDITCTANDDNLRILSENMTVTKQIFCLINLPRVERGDF